MMICTQQLSDISSHLLLSNVETMSVHAPSPAHQCLTKEAKPFCRDLGVQKTPSLSAIISGTRKDDSEREMLSRRINNFVRNGSRLETQN